MVTGRKKGRQHSGNSDRYQNAGGNRILDGYHHYFRMVRNYGTAYAKDKWAILYPGEPIPKKK